MEFRVINRNGRGDMITHSEKCLPTIEQAKSMLENGYKFQLDGKILSKANALAFISDSQKRSKVSSSDKSVSDAHLF